MTADPERPYGFVQWKGTNVCMDLYCVCGEQAHVDVDFAYTWLCLACGRSYVVEPFVRLREAPMVDGKVDGFDPVVNVVTPEGVEVSERLEAALFRYAGDMGRLRAEGVAPS